MNEIDDAGLRPDRHLPLARLLAGLPVRTDAEQAFWPDAVYVIVSLAGGGADLKGYLIAESGITEEPIEIE